ncbi:MULTISPECIES: CYTH domain-containing protein [Motilimonas]|uniref:CYTH domain-containing protein n=1 Tax=Motilimonas cestriensis TaxID=2742685 RepID=A0ABS8W892_9GAMM|nr:MULTISPECIES: CYTH domain-containing protein [Motilimonas]MCE0556486.1 CYTH domain-containing protein [Motilimonas sp. E26]MCE2594327.1 CYTH domain-containing protein [Motilimonas cestriensis]MDO6527115.1 CYTH domain-containing protein [Motilimonas sp. 1_MG-2023]
MQEIERKFLVTGDYKNDAFKAQRITQGYLNSAPERCVRVRIKGEQGFLTIKGISDAAGLSRFEWEREIPVAEAQALLALCEPGVIDKTRYLVKAGLHTFEVDEFYGDNAGLVVAEVELTSVDEAFAKPSWLGEEVTGDKRYYNSQLMQQPYSLWSR